VFGLSAEKLLIIGVIAAFLIGPDRLPVYAQKLAQFVKNVKRMAEGAKTQISDEMGEDFQELDWKKLDPRQYDPRRIIREALQEEPGMNPAQKLNSAKPTRTATLLDGEAAPFDSEAT
jgi:sec-independent protein translocase protein TatB